MWGERSFDHGSFWPPKADLLIRFLYLRPILVKKMGNLYCDLSTEKAFSSRAVNSSHLLYRDVESAMNSRFSTTFHIVSGDIK